MKNKKLHILFFGIQILLGLFFIFAGSIKFFPNPSTGEAFAKVSEYFWVGPWARYLVAVWEIAAGLLVMIPKTWRLGATLGFLDMVGATIVNLSPANDKPNLWVLTALFALLFLAIGIYRGGGMRQFCRWGRKQP